MKHSSILVAFASLLTGINAVNIQVNFYWDTSCAEFAASEYINVDGHGTYTVGGPYGSRGGLFVNSNDYRNEFYTAFTNYPGDPPFTGENSLYDGECIGSLSGLYAEIDY
ncbi:hypothetical protein DPV78_007254 [Talaromyces pinophilus]|nr:hypothetical protein DPV78_007254 [Talaromyces pinophilus]